MADPVKPPLSAERVPVRPTGQPIFPPPVPVAPAAIFIEETLPASALWPGVHPANVGGESHLPDAAGQSRKRTFSIEASDIVALGVVILSIGAVGVAFYISTGFVHGKVPAKEATEIILGCVSGSAITGVAAAILGGKNKVTRGRSRKAISIT
jgi:hypothetical protein